MLVEQGKTVSQNILTDWTDPDGDDLVLMDAKADNEQDQVKVRRDGLLTYQDSGAAAGQEIRHRDRLGRPRHHHRQSGGQRPAARRPAARGQRRPRHRRRRPGPRDRAAEERRRPQRRRAAPRPGGSRRPRRAGPRDRRRNLHFPQQHPRARLPDLHRQQRPAKQPGPDPGGRRIRQGRRQPGGRARRRPDAGRRQRAPGPAGQRLRPVRRSAGAAVRPAAGQRHRLGQRDRPQRPADHRRRRHQGPVHLPLHHVQRHQVRHRQRLRGPGPGPRRRRGARSPNRTK